jgi:hypothetical protein
MKFDSLRYQIHRTGPVIIPLMHDKLMPYQLGSIYLEWIIWLRWLRIGSFALIPTICCVNLLGIFMRISISSAWGEHRCQMPQCDMTAADCLMGREDSGAKHPSWKCHIALFLRAKLLMENESCNFLFNNKNISWNSIDIIFKPLFSFMLFWN